MRVFLLYLSFFSIGSIVTVAQNQQSVSSLLDDLAKPQKTIQAAAALIKMIEARPWVGDDLSTVLPNLILNATDIEVVHSEASLIGRLKLVSAIPALIQLLDRPNLRDATITLTRSVELYDDPVGRALADIGAPAIQPLMTPLESAKVDTRRRAARILIRINTPESLSVLRQHVGKETDSELKSYIATNLARTAK